MKRRGLGNHVYQAFFTVCCHLVAPTVTCLTGVRYFGVPDIRRLGGVLIVANHQSYLDPALVTVALERPVHYLARRSLFRMPGFGLAIRALGAHPVERGRMGAAVLREILKVLRSGEPLLLFPEGTRTQDGSLGEFRPGVAAIAARCSVPVLPVCIEGAFECWPRTRRFPVPARVAVAYGDLLWPQKSGRSAFAETLTERIADMQQSLRRYLGRCPENVAEEPAGRLEELHSGASGRARWHA